MTKSVTSVKEQSEELNTRSVSNTTGLMFKTTFEVDVEEYDGWMDLRGKVISNETHHVEKALELIKEFDETLIKNGKEPHYERDFELANKNKGYDAGEFLVINFGYIAIEGHKAIYGKYTTSMQRKALGCILEDGFLLKADMQAEKEKALAAERQWVIDMQSYYTDSTNAFHCPSGIPRMGF